MIDFSKMIDPYRKYNTEYIKYINNYKNFVLLGDSLTLFLGTVILKDKDFKLTILNNI